MATKLEFVFNRCHLLIIHVMLHLKVRNILENHILKRWTKIARDVLPEKLLRYQKDQGSQKIASFRHSRLYVKALECVRLGDNNVNCYEICSAMLADICAKLAPLSVDRDGMGLADREAAEATLGGGPDGSNVDGVSGGSQLSAPEKKMKRGRPTTSRDKPPYEQPKKRSRFCTICRVEGHRSTTCPMSGDFPKAPRKLPKCSRCGVVGHRENACGNLAKPWEVPFL